MGSLDIFMGSLGIFMGSLDIFMGSLDIFMGSLGIFMGPLGFSWVPLGFSWVPLGFSWVPLGFSWVPFGFLKIVVLQKPGHGFHGAGPREPHLRDAASVLLSSRRALETKTSDGPVWLCGCGSESMGMFTGGTGF